MTTSPAVSAMADQALAVINEVEHRCGANEHLLEDPLLGALPVAAARFWWGFTVMSGERFGEAMCDGPRVYERHDMECDRCHELTNFAGGRTLELPAGASIVRARCCSSCVVELEVNFKPLHWS